MHLPGSDTNKIPKSSLLADIKPLFIYLFLISKSLLISKKMEHPSILGPSIQEVNYETITIKLSSYNDKWNLKAERDVKEM